MHLRTSWKVKYFSKLLKSKMFLGREFLGFLRSGLSLVDVSDAFFSEGSSLYRDLVLDTHYLCGNGEHWTG